MAQITTAEAIVASLIAHRLDTIYALPGVQNDPLFDALFKASNRIRTVHTRHEQGAAYMALGAALATGRPQATAVVPGPGLLNASAALLTAYSMNAGVLALVGQIPDFDIGRKLGHLHEMNDQAGILARLVDHSALVPGAAQAPRMVAEAFHAMRSGRPGPAALECSLNVWGKAADVTLCDPLPVEPPAIDEDALRDAARRLGSAKHPMIVVGGGAQDASPEVTTLSEMLQAPVLCGFRRGQGVLDSRNPLAVTLPLGRELWGEADVVLAVGTRLFFQHKMWGVDGLDIIAVNADPEEPAKQHKPAVALIGDAAPILRALIDALHPHNGKRKSRRAEMVKRQAKWGKKLARLAPQAAILEAIRAELPEDGIFVDEVTQVGFAARLMLPVYRPRTFLSPGYQDNLGWGYATALGAQDARRDVPVLSINGDGGFMYTANELATAVRHRIPLVAVVFADGSFGNVRRIQEENYGNRLIASDLANPDFVKFAESFGAAAERVRTPEALRKALKRGFKRRDTPTLIEMPVGAMPSPWEFILMGKVR
ncbi:MAG TPA: thiamine pyrophosphate-dependent enzyme [Xanthobacteraceae bacterium]|nr:thiamine pyrophosphate-dependent enzyme [Xanthobacteraceae bacterium]